MEIRSGDTIQADWQFGEYGQGMQFTASCPECGDELTAEPYGGGGLTAKCKCGVTWELNIEFVARPRD